MAAQLAQHGSTKAASKGDSAVASLPPGRPRKAPARPFQRGSTPPLARDAEKELDEQGKLYRQWKAWRREKLDALLAGPHGREVKGLVRLMDTMTLSSAAALVQLIERAVWIKAMSPAERADLLGAIGQRITRLRERNGLTPFDDPMPGQPDGAFHRIKALLDVR